jgi:hypothetical protein
VVVLINDVAHLEDLHDRIDADASHDHPQYLLADGTRALTGDVDMGGNDLTEVANIQPPAGVELGLRDEAGNLRVGLDTGGNIEFYASTGGIVARYTDGTGAWTFYTDTELASTEIGSVKITDSITLPEETVRNIAVKSTAPSITTATIWFDTTAHVVKYWNGAAWVAI